MQHTRRKISKQERDVWLKRPANLIGQGLYTRRHDRFPDLAGRT